VEKFANYSEAEVRKNIVRARGRGYVVSDVVELPGVRTIAVPIFDKNNHPVAAISVSTLSTRLDKDRTELVLDCLNEAIAQIQPNLLSIETEN
jgi:DNA-binding IclR family transcriptional regulator